MNPAASRDTQPERRHDIAMRLRAVAQLVDADDWAEAEPFADQLLASAIDRFERLRADEFAIEYRSIVDDAEAEWWRP